MRISDWSSDVCSSDLAKDSLRPGKGDDVVHGQEIIGIVALGDETEFFFQRLAHFQGKARAIAGMGGGPGQFLQPLLRRPSFRHGFMGILIGKLVEREMHPAQKMRSEEHTSELQSLMRISY